MTTFIDEALFDAESATGPLAASPLEVYESGLDTQQLWVQDRRGGRSLLPVSDWSGQTLAGDGSLLARCGGPTLDIGCGPGRLVAALAAAGREALGIDVSAGAVARACAAGGNAVRRSIFGPVPGHGRWAVALLADGNIGIGGDPLALLQRTRQLLTADGLVLAEVTAPGGPTSRTTIRLQDREGRVSEWFDWAQVGVDGVEDLATSAGLELHERWQSAGRWFVSLRPR